MREKRIILNHESHKAALSKHKDKKINGVGSEHEGSPLRSDKRGGLKAKQVIS